MGAPEGIRTPNLLIRRRGKAVHLVLAAPLLCWFERGGSACGAPISGHADPSVTSPVTRELKADLGPRTVFAGWSAPVSV